MKIAWKRVLSLMLVAGMALGLLAACGEGGPSEPATQTENSVSSTTEPDLRQPDPTETTAPAAIETTEPAPTETIPSTTAPVIDDYWADVEHSQALSPEERDLIKAIYEQREIWATKNDEESQEFTRLTVDLSQILFGAVDDTLYFVGLYDFRYFSAYKVGEDGKLTKVKWNTIYGFTGQSIQRNYPLKGQKSEQLNVLCASYSQYKENRQEVLGDVEPIPALDLSVLTEGQRKLYDSMLANLSRWQNAESDSYSQDWTHCTEFNVWHFGDGTCEMYCIYDDRSVRGYALSGDTIRGLEDNEFDRLLNDLNGKHKKCQWKSTWSQEKKEYELYQYILNYCG